MTQNQAKLRGKKLLLGTRHDKIFQKSLYLLKNEIYISKLVSMKKDKSEFPLNL